MKLEAATRALVCWWVASGAQALSVRVRLLERLGVDCPREVVAAYVDELHEEMAVERLRPYHVMLGIEEPRPLTPLEADALQREAMMRARVLRAWMARAPWDEVVESARLCGRDGEFARRVVDDYKMTRNVRGIRRRVSVIDDD